MLPASPAGTVTVSQRTSGHSIVVTTAVELIGVSLLALIAGINDNIGSIVVILMAGFLLVWALTNVSQLQSIVGKA